jgi:hypothetical protein
VAAVVAAPLLFLSACGEEVTVSVPDLPDMPDVSSLGELSETVREGTDGIAQILAEQYQLTDVGAVDCPPNLDLSQGATFECTVMVAGEERTVEVDVLNADGQIQVSEPK